MKPVGSESNHKVVCVTVCTAGRPIMLRRCLLSLIAQDQPEGWSMHIVVVDNERGGPARGLVEMIKADSDTPIHYGVEENQGIPFARNKSLEIALQCSPDWIAFIDDDEVAETGWLKAFCLAADNLRSDVFMGPVVLEYPNNTPQWVERRDKNMVSTGTPLSYGCTFNTFMRSDIVSIDGLGLRFDERFRFTGGGDTFFFSQVIAAGRTIVAVNEARVREVVPESRVSVKWQYSRMMRVNAENAIRDVQRVGLPVSLLPLLGRAFEKVITATFMAFLFCVTSLISKKTSAKYFRKMLKKLAQAEGALRGILGKLPEPYRTIDGF